MSKTIIYDLDGTLADLSKGLAKLEGYDDPVAWYLRNEVDYGKYVYPKVIEKHIDNGCFADLPPMPNFDKHILLMETFKSYGYKIKILSSCMDYDYSDKIKDQKITWVKKHLANLVNDEDIHIVRNSSSKINYITDSQTYLIDDYSKIRNQFIENGLGDQFILYKNFYDCVQQLKSKDII